MERTRAASDRLTAPDERRALVIRSVASSEEKDCHVESRAASSIALSMVDRPIPFQIPGLANVIFVSAGSQHSAVVRSDGTVNGTPNF